MKKLFSLLLVLALCLSLFPAALAEGPGRELEATRTPDPGMILVHASVPASWTDPCGWAWTDGRSVFEAWPGEPMEPDGDWYTIQIPVWANYFIVNANNGSVQTEDLSIGLGNEVWITVQEDGRAEVAIEPPELLDSGECGDQMIWTLDENGTLMISGTGEMWDFASDEAPWSSQVNGLFALFVSPDVTSIGENAFSACCNLSSVTIPSSVTKIGSRAFFGCVSLPGITIPRCVTSIGMQSFASCSSLTNMTIPAGVAHIGDRAFADCGSLTEIRFEGSAPDFGDNAFYGVAATARYPADDESWTGNVLQGYGGSVIWVSYESDPGVVSVHASVPASWTGPCVWAWSGGGNVFETWPGKAMEPDGDWYTIQIPSWASF